MSDDKPDAAVLAIIEAGGRHALVGVSQAFDDPEMASRTFTGAEVATLLRSMATTIYGLGQPPRNPPREIPRWRIRLAVWLGRVTRRWLA